MFFAKRCRLCQLATGPGCFITVQATSGGGLQWDLCDGTTVVRAISVGTNTFYECVDVSTITAAPSPYVTPTYTYTYSSVCS